MKSPIYGGGRNHKHRAQASNRSAANVNLRGKKYRLMTCKCCYCIDERDSIKRKLLDKEILNALSGIE